MLEGLSSSNYELNDVTGDENCECDYEVERQLIRQIVERTKKGSPVFQNARSDLLLLHIVIYCNCEHCSADYITFFWRGTLLCSIDFLTNISIIFFPSFIWCEDLAF